MPDAKLAQQLVPYPLLGVISPWNFPLMLSAIDAIPALIAGSAAIIKPSEVTPRFIEPLLESIADVPELEKVLAYVQGPGETGQAIIENVDIDNIGGLPARLAAAFIAQLARQLVAGAQRQMAQYPQRQRVAQDAAHAHIGFVARAQAVAVH